MTATKTVTKPAKSAAKPAAKSVTKAAPKSAAKAPLFYATLLADALAGKYGANIQRFYATAAAYHKKAATAFPRARLAAEPLLNPEDAVAFLKKHEVTSIPPGSKVGQRLYDEMIVQASAR